MRRVVQPTLADPPPGRELLEAVNKGDPKRVGQLLAQGVNVEARDENLQTALFIACLLGLAEIAILLVRGKARVNAKCQKQALTPLMVASVNGDIRIVNLLVKSGADLDLVDIDGRTALMYAAMNGRKNVVVKLCESGADRRIKDERGSKTAFDFTSDEGLRKLLRVRR
jgi:ankyrin repeat protein